MISRIEPLKGFGDICELLRNPRNINCTVLSSCISAIININAALQTSVTNNVLPE